MGANTYLKAAGSIGYNKQSATATALIKTIAPYAGYKPVVYAFQFVSGTVLSAACQLSFLRSNGRTTTSAASGSGTATIRLTSTSIGGTTSSDSVTYLATGDYVCIELDNGNFTVDTIASIVASTSAVNPVGYCEVTNVHLDDIAAGNRIWGLGLEDDGSTVKYLLSSVTVVNTVYVADGLLYGKAAGDPLVPYFLNASSTVLGIINYITYGYVNA